MGEELFDQFSSMVKSADEILGYSVAELCTNGPNERLVSTSFTQPAIYVVTALSFLDKQRNSSAPDYLLGHSVAEYVALFASGVIDFESGLRLVKKRGELMGQAKAGGMAAVLGLKADEVANVLEQHAVQNVFIANLNTPHQIVLSGLREEVEGTESLFLNSGATHFKMLQVGGAFHTPLMANAQEQFQEFIHQFSFAPPTIPVISNVTSRPHVAGHIAELMVQQITAPVRWSDSIRYVLAKGVGVNDFEEISPAIMPIVKPMVIRTNAEAGPLDLAILAQEELATTQDSLVANERSSISSVYDARSLGSARFCEDFNLKYAYLAGGMYQGIASVDIVVRMAKAGLMAFFGTGGLKIEDIESAILTIQSRIANGSPYGVNFIAHSNFPELEESLVDLLLKHQVRTIEASAFMEVTPSLVRYRAKGLVRQSTGNILALNKIIAKVSRPDVGAQFLSPAPDRIINKLLESNMIDREQAELLSGVPMVDALCVESDSGGHTDQGMPFTLVPAMLRVRDEYQQRYPTFGPIYVGGAGGIGTPEAAAALFVMGVDFILTGSINQCTIEAGTSDVVKDLLQAMNVYDTDYAPSGELFELGAKVQVLKKGLFFPARANKLVALYHQYEGIEQIDSQTRQQIEGRYFKRSFDDVFSEVRSAYPSAEIERAERLPKHRMALIFKRYFKDATRWALTGNLEHKVDFQIHCGPALGAFNQWIAGGPLIDWRERHVDDIASLLMQETAALLNKRFLLMHQPRVSH